MKASKIALPQLIAVLSVAWLGVFYINRGTQLTKPVSLAGALSPALLGSLALLGVFPLVAKKNVRLHSNSQNLRRLA